LQEGSLSAALPALLGLHAPLLAAGVAAAERGGWAHAEGDLGLRGVRLQAGPLGRLELIQLAGRWQLLAPNATLPLSRLLKERT
jgi:hypothetical protein